MLYGKIVVIFKDPDKRVIAKVACKISAIIKNGSRSKEAVRPYVKYKILNAFQNKVLSVQETDSR